MVIDAARQRSVRHLACGAVRFGSVPASPGDQPDRSRPQLRLAV